MNISNLFTKDSLIKLFVILVVLAFILELFVLLPGQPVQQQPQTPITNENDSGSLPTVKDRFLGIAAVNATIVKYDDSLVLSGKDLGSANVIISDLIKTNKVSYKTNVNEDTLVLNLPANANVSEIVVSFRGLNLSIVGRASLRINGTAQFTAPNLSRVDVAIERDILLTLDVANKPVGSNVTVSLRALIEDGKIQQMEEPTIAPLSRNFLVNGTIVRVRQQGIVFAQVEWESRNEVNVSRLNLNFTNITTNRVVAYDYNSSVFVIPELTFEQVISVTRLSYVEKASSVDIVVNGTVNKSQVENDVGLIAGENVSLTFPRSIARVDFVSLNSSKAEVLKFFPNNTDVEIYKSVEVELPKLVRDDNSTFTLVSKRIDVLVKENSASVNNSFDVLIKADVQDDRIVRYEVLDIVAPVDVQQPVIEILPA